MNSINEHLFPHELQRRDYLHISFSLSKLYSIHHQFPISLTSHFFSKGIIENKKEGQFVKVLELRSNGQISFTQKSDRSFRIWHIEDYNSINFNMFIIKFDAFDRSLHSDAVLLGCDECGHVGWQPGGILCVPFDGNNGN
jgi:hypothetical protein